MKGTYAPMRRPRRFARAHVVVLVGVLMTATIAALTLVHVPQPSSLTATYASTDLVATATQPIVAGHVGHPSPGSDPSDATCATCGADLDGAAFACALVLFVIAVMRLTARPQQPSFALTGRRWVARDRLAALSAPQTPNLYALCVSRT